MAAAPVTSERHGRTDVVDLALLTVAVTQLAFGALAFLAPGAFYDLVASFPPENAHFAKDIGAWQIGLGAAALAAVRRPAWRVPMLGVLAVHYTLHAISHILDAGVADPAWQGAFGVVTQVLGAVVLTALFLRERAR